MLEVRRNISLAFLLLLLFTMTAAAQDAIIHRGCRVGTPRPEGMVSHRGAPGGQPRQAGGDFYHGHRHQLTVLVAFADQSFLGDETATIQQWNKIFNVENFNEGSFVGSVRDYFYAQSFGDFNITFDLQYVVVSGQLQKYKSNAADDENSQYLVEDVMEILKQRNIDWSLYDWNGDGYINQLLIIYAGKGQNAGGGSNTIWPHQWWMSEHLKDGQTGVYCDPIPVSYNSKQYLVDCYCALAECDSRNSYGTFGTICHEYTHCFGFPDIYYRSNNYAQSWELMDNGNYNGGGYCPAGYSAHERWLMQWLTPVELTEAASITEMPALADQATAYLIRNDGLENEYYIVENRQQTSWDTSLPGSGILVFHIDFDPDLWVSVDDYVNKPARQHYVLFHANNSTTYRGWAYPAVSNYELTNTSSPAATLWNANTDGTFFMNKPLTNMLVTGNLASFDFMGGTTAIDIPSTTPATTPSVVYDLQGRQIEGNKLGKGLYIIRGRKVVVR